MKKNEEKIEEEVYKKNNINDNEIILFDKNEINNNNKTDKDLFLEIKSIHDYLDSQIKKDLNEVKNEELKSDKNISENILNENLSDDNIFIKYLKDPEIIFKKKDIDNNNLKCLFNEIDYDIEKENNIIFPFINVCENLVKAYIESNLDDEEDIQRLSSLPENDFQDTESFYQKVFKKLKNNCFINKEIIISIYDYFSELYHKFNDIKDDDILFKKFDKMIKLFKIFYEKNDNKNKENKSSICFLGTNFKIIFDEKIILSNEYKINIKINILNNYMHKIKNTAKLKLIKINDIELNYQVINIKFEELNEIDFNIYPDSIYLESKGLRGFKYQLKCNIKEVKEIFFLENFYGQLSSIIVSIIANDNKIEYEFVPISIRNDNCIYYYKKFINKTERLYSTPIIQINDINLVKINYINFNDDNFNIVDYFGGVIQFLPFYQIFKNLNELKALNKIGEAIINLADFIIKIIIKQLFSTNNSFKLFKKYILLVYYLLLDLDLVQTLNISEIITDKYKKNNNELYYYIEFLQSLYLGQKNSYSFDIKTEVKEIIDNREFKEYTDLNIFKYPQKDFKQLYKHYMRKLFIFNIFWSKKSIFFKNKVNSDNEEQFKEVKYKQTNYYTRNFQFPYFYPILELREYYPSFSKCKGGIFLGFDSKIIKYNFELKENEKATDIINQLIPKKKSKKDEISEKCCLLKNTHHVQGILKIVKKNKNKNFKLIFKSQKEKESEFCNKKIKKDKKKDGELLCYGSIFECPKREYNRSIIIKSNEILFVLIRDYFHRVSAIEIFTLNKSYYFNFYNQFDINNIKKNKILNEFRLNPLFKEIKIKKDKLILGYYNISYKAYLFPIFNDDVNVWDNKIKFLCNYDILILINLFSNRSFRDVYQYPIFPTLYNWIKLERNMSNHIGFQDINKDSKKRKEIIIDFFKSNEEDSDCEETYLFNIHYSNPAFVFNYLLRVLPYSFMAIEFQGDDFDNPNRLFYSIEKTLKSTLNLKSDLREMIPELFYMMEIYYNKNNLSFDKLYDGTEINYVQIYPQEEEKNNKMKNIAKFISEMRKSLEKEKHLNEWIDLIFGINQKYYLLDGKNYKYYPSYSEIMFKNDKKLLNDEIKMKSIDFGLLPYQLFNKNFPIRNIINEQKEKELDSFNLSLLNYEHIKEIKSPVESFICRGSIYINDNYIKIIDKKEEINILENYGKNHNSTEKLKNKLNNYIINNIFGSLNLRNIEFPDLGLINYYFIGNIFGEISIFSLIESKDENNQKNKENNLPEENNFIEECKGDSKKTIYNLINKLNNAPILIDNNKSISTFGIKLIKKLNDHSKEIKYIDFNPRLNIFLSYSLDNFINVYIFPKLKLINIIDTDLFKESDDKKFFDEVILLSYPFPSILCHNKENIYLLSINGEKIKYQKLQNNEKILIFIDKNLGLLPDKIEIVNSKDGSRLSIFNEINE